MLIPAAVNLFLRKAPAAPRWRECCLSDTGNAATEPLGASAGGLRGYVSMGPLCFSLSAAVAQKQMFFK